MRAASLVNKLMYFFSRTMGENKLYGWSCVTLYTIYLFKKSNKEFL